MLMKRKTFKFWAVIMCCLSVFSLSAASVTKTYYAASSGSLACGTIVDSIPGVTMSFGSTVDGTKVFSFTTAKVDSTYNGVSYTTAYNKGDGQNVSMSNNIPTKGCFYKFTTAYNGKLDVVCWARSGKQLYITEQVNGEAPATIYGNYNGNKPSADQIMCFTIDAKEAHTYYVFQNSGQMGIFGFTFTGDPDAPFESPILNPSFENGTSGTIDAKSYSAESGGNKESPTSWTLYYNFAGWNDANTKATTPSEGSTIFNLWAGTTNAIDLYQDITLPKGVYTLSADLRTEKAEQVTNQRVYAALNYLVNYSDTLPWNGSTWDAIEGWNTLTTTFYLPKEQKIRIGASSTGGSNSKGWFQIDNFRLTRSAYDSTIAVTGLDQMIAKATEVKDLPMMASAKTSLNAVLTNAQTMDRTEANVRSACAAMDSVLAIAIPSVDLFISLKEAIDTANAVYSADAPRVFKSAIDHAQYVYDNGVQSEIEAAVAAINVNTLMFKIHYISSAAGDTIDLTDWIVNPTFDTNIEGWTTTTDAKNSALANNKDGDFTIPFWENWNSAAYTGKMYQTIANVPNGTYIFKLAAFTNGTASVFANDSMLAAAADPTFREVTVEVANNTLEFGLNITSAGWCGIDNASLRFVKASEKPYLSFNLNGNVATVENVGQLVDALRWDYEDEDITIELKNCTDDIRVYMLGKNRFAFPQTFGDITIKNAEGATPVLAGSLTSSNGVKAKTLLYEGLTWDYSCVIDPVSGTDKAIKDSYNYNSKEFSPFNLQAVDSIMESMSIQNCNVYNLPLAHLFISGSNIPNNTLIKKIQVEGCYIKNAGVQQDTTSSQSGHFVQIKNANTFECDQFIFRDNIIENWSNSQVFNVSRKGTTADSIAAKFYVEISNNTFYKFGGKANNARNFVEYSQNDGLQDREVNICNNFFYERASYKFYPHSKLTMFAPVEGQTLKLNVLNNFFFPDTVVAGKDEKQSLAVQGGIDTLSNVAYARKDLTLADFKDTIVYATGTIFSSKNALYTAGVEGTHIGAIDMYYVPAFTESATGAVVENLQQLTEALAYDEYDAGKDVVIEVKNCTDEGGIYQLGSSVKTYGDFDNLTIQAAEGETPVLTGSFVNANRYVMDNFIFNGLTFMGDTISSADALSPIRNADATCDTVNVLTVKNCTFNKLGKEQVLRIRSGVFYDIVFDGCTIDNYGYKQQDGGNHPFQFNKGQIPTVSSFTLKESVISNYQGKQFINFSNVKPIATCDSSISINVENNTFYKFSGNGWWNKAIQYRNFIEFPKNFGYKTTTVNVNNNLFYENYCDTMGIANRLALFTPDTVYTLNVSVQNNLFVPDSVMYQMVDGMTDSCNLPLYGATVNVERNDLFLSDLEGVTLENLWVSESDMTIYKTSPLYVGGMDGSYIGAKSMYIKNLAGLPVVGYFTLQKDMAATAAPVNSDPIYNALNADDNLNVVLNVVTDKSATAEVDLTPYDVIIIQESFGGADGILTPAGALGIAKLNVPTIYNKTYAFKNGRAISSGSSAGADIESVYTLTVEKDNQAWALFDGVEFSDTNTVAMFFDGATDAGLQDGSKHKGLNYIKSLNGIESTLLAVPTGVTNATACINFVPAGTVLASETTAADMFIFGMNSGALLANNGKNVTEDNLKIWKNAVYILAGITEERPRNLVGLKKIGYFSKQKDMDATAATVAKDPIYSFLRSDDSLNVVMNALTDVSALATIDLSGYDAIIVQESMGGGDAILMPGSALGLSNITVPCLYNKMYAMKGGRAFASATGTGKEATGVLDIKLNAKYTSSLFDGIEADGDSIILFTAAANDLGAEGTKALNYAASVAKAGTQLAAPKGIEAALAINYFAAGDTLGDQVLAANMITMGQNFGALCAQDGANITDANFQLWKNATYILAGLRDLKLSKVTSIESAQVFNNVFVREGNVYVNTNAATTINVYNVLGGLVKTINANEGMNTIEGLNRGQMYIIRTGAENVKVVL